MMRTERIKTNLYTESNLNSFHKNIDESERRDEEEFKRETNRGMSWCSESIGA
jgi:hypothetical protein